MSQLSSPTSSCTGFRVLAFGAHPDDCELCCGGLAAKMTARGDAVKFVSVTNGNAGHHRDDRNTLKQRRIQEAQNAAAVLGIEYEVLDHNDGELMSSLDIRHSIIRRIREWQADIVLTHRPNDYHPDHRYTSMMVQDAAYMVMVPPVCPDVPPIKQNPYFFYFWDSFKKPYPFQPDIALSVDEIMDKKWDMMHAHTSQFYEWLPFVEGLAQSVPADSSQHRDWLISTWSPWLSAMTRDCRNTLIQRYGAESASSIQFAETFEICEYGRQPDKNDLDRIFPQ